MQNRKKGEEKMKFLYHKLVRDKIPQNIINVGKTCQYTILNQEEYTKQLDRKLKEEVEEFVKEHEISEMADILEVLEAIQKNDKMNIQEVEKIKEQKKEKKGAFENKIYLESVIEDTPIEQNKENKQQMLWESLGKDNSLQEVQSYVKEVNTIRGFQNQPVQDTMLLLTEEIGELAKAIRKDATAMRIDKEKVNHYESIQSEVADCFYVLLSICNKLEIDVFSSLKEKEKENIHRKWS